MKNDPAMLNVPTVHCAERWVEMIQQFLFSKELVKEIGYSSSTQQKQLPKVLLIIIIWEQ